MSANQPPQSRVEEGIHSIIGDKVELEPPQSRVEEDLLELKEIIEQGGGGGTTDYEQLSNRPSVNGTTLSGDKTADDLELASKEEVDNILDGQELDSFGDVETALRNKQNKTDDTLETTSKNVVGAINEVKNGLTDLYKVVEDNTPYVSRTARDGLVKMSLVGATIAWNQQLNNFTGMNEARGTTFSKNADGSIHIQGTASGSHFANAMNFYFTEGHRYFVSALGMKAGMHFEIIAGEDTLTSRYLIRVDDVDYQSIFTFTKEEDGEYCTLGVYVYNGYSGTTDLKLNAIDLTIMFGSVIADYVYSLEQAEAGSGIAWLKSYGFFTKDYYAYDAGSLQSVCTSTRKVTTLDGTVRTYPIVNQQLRGLFKLDANNKLYADGDIYPSSGSGTYKYGIVDLGSLEWFYQPVNETYPYGHFMTLEPITEAESDNLICTKYVTKMATNIDQIIYSIITGNIIIIDSTYSDVSTFKAAMSGIYLVYELDESTTFLTDGYINPQRSEGIEEFVDGLTRDVMVPVGNESTYYISEVLPSSSAYTDAMGAYMFVDTEFLLNFIKATQSILAPVLETLVAPGYGIPARAMFIYGGVLYRTTEDIAGGETIIIEGNCYQADYITNYIAEMMSLFTTIESSTRRTRRNITTDLANLSTAVAEQNLEMYGYTIGDYFIGDSGYTYILADMNTFRGAQNNYAVINQNHISIVVKTGANSKWNETNDTSTGYAGSVLHSYMTGTVLENIKSDFKALFGGSTGLEHLLSHKLLWTTAVSAWDWSADAQYISALTEPQVYGTTIWSIDGYQTGEAWKQLELFKKFSYMELFGWIWFWLRSIHSATRACDASGYGHAYYDDASFSGGVVGLITFTSLPSSPIK